MTPLRALSELPGVLCVMRHAQGELVCEGDAPLAISLADAETLARRALRFVEGYRAAGRSITQSWLQFPEAGVLLAPHPGGPTSHFLLLLVEDQMEVPAILAAAQRYWEHV